MAGDCIIAGNPVTVLCGYQEGRTCEASLLRCVHPLRRAGGSAGECAIYRDGGARRLAGAIDLWVTADVGSALREAAALEDDDLVIEADRVEFLSAAGAATRVQTAQSLTAGRRMILRRPSRVVQRVMGLLWGDEPRLMMTT